jgi:LysR family transcriptional regulator, glycine cleavage system transcriptional activator
MAQDRLPPLNALKAFEAVARHMSFTKAADELKVTPGAISQHIRSLEEEIGTPLFKRLGRQILLTDAAQSALPALREGFDRITDAARLMRQPLGRRKVAVSVAPSFAAKWLVPRMDSFHSAHPEIEIWISADMTTVDFSVADVDIAIRYGAGLYEGCVSEKLLNETIVPVAAPSLVNGFSKIEKPADLAKHTLLHDGSVEQDPTCPDWPMWLKARGVQGVDAARGPRFNQTSLVIEAAAAGRGVALAKRAIAQSDLEAGRLLALFEDATPLAFAYWLVWPKGRTLTQPLRAFMNWVREEAKKETASAVAV